MQGKTLLLETIPGQAREQSSSKVAVNVLHTLQPCFQGRPHFVSGTHVTVVFVLHQNQVSHFSPRGGLPHVKPRVKHAVKHTVRFHGVLTRCLLRTTRQGCP